MGWVSTVALTVTMLWVLILSYRIATGQPRESAMATMIKAGNVGIDRQVPVSTARRKSEALKFQLQALPSTVICAANIGTCGISPAVACCLASSR